MVIDNCDPQIQEKKSATESKEKDPLEGLPKWKRDKMIKERQAAEEKARQEEQKRKELEDIRNSIRKKKKNDDVNQIDRNGEPEPDTNQKVDNKRHLEEQKAIPMEIDN